MADNNLDPEEIRRLNESIRELTDNTKTLGGSFSGFDKTTDSTKATVKRLTTELERLIITTVAINSANSQFTDQGGKTQKGLKVVSQSSGELTRNFKNLSRSTEGLITQFDALSKTISKITNIKVPNPAKFTPSTGAAGGDPAAGSFEAIMKSKGFRWDETLGEAVKIAGDLTEKEKEIIRSIDKRLKKEADLQKVEDEKLRLAEEGGKILKENADKIKDGSGFLSILNDRMFALAGTSKLATGSLMLLTAASTGLWNATKVMTKEIYNGARGASVSAKALSELTKEIGTVMQAVGFTMALLPIGRLAKAFGLLLGTVGVVTEVFGAANEIAAEQSDKLFKTYNDLSRAGILLTDGVTGVMNVLQTMGMTVAELEEFKDILGQNTSRMKMLGATTSEGALVFADISGSIRKSNLGRTLELLGISAKEQHQSVMSFMSQQTRMGLMQSKSTKDLIKGSADYLRELVLITELTGATRQEQEDARNAIMAIDSLRAAMAEAEERGDTKELARLERYFEAATILQAKGLNRLATGAAQYAGGKIISEEAGAFYQTLPRFINGLERGEKASNLLGDAAKDLKDTTNRFNSTVKFGGDVSSVVGDQYSKILDFLKTLEKGRKEEKAPEQIIKEILERVQAAPDPKTEALVDAARKYQNASMIMDRTVESFSKAADISKAASTAFDKAVNTFSRVVGSRPVQGGQYAQPPAPPTPSAPPPSPQSRGPGMSTEERLARLRFRDRQENLGGGPASDQIIALAEKIQEVIPGTTFTALNDKFHQRERPNSAHTRGKALDFAVNPAPANIKESTAIKQQIQALGAYKVRDEYFADRDANTTGGHFHAEVARYGGAFSGPNSGYPVWLHKNEAAVPMQAYRALLSDATNSITNYRNEVTKQPLSSVTPISTGPNVGSLLNELISITQDSYDRMYDEMRKNRFLQEDILTAVRQNA